MHKTMHNNEAIRQCTASFKNFFFTFLNIEFNSYNKFLFAYNK